MTTLPEEAVKAAKDVLYYANPNDVERALTAAAPHLAAERVNSDQIEAARKAVEELAHVQMNLPLEDWSRISSAILFALEPSAARELALEEGDLQELLERLDAGLEYEGELETENDHIELFNVEAAQDLFADAATAIRALSSPDHSSDARNMVQDHIADAGKLAGADRPSVKGTIPTAFGDSVCFSGIDHSALILVSVRGNSGLVPIKYLLPHQLYVHDVQKLSEQGEVLVCAVPVYDQQINVTSAIPSAQSEGAE